MTLKQCLTIAAVAAACTMFGNAGASAEEKAKTPAAVVKASPLPDPVARVNGVAIPAADLQKALNAFSKSPAAAQVPPGKEKEVQQSILKHMVDEELMYQISSKISVKDLDKLVDNEILKFKTRFKTEADYNKSLLHEGISEKDIRRAISRKLTFYNYVNQTIVPKQVVSDSEVKVFYEKNPERFSKPEQVRASHILIKVDAKATVSDKKKAKEKIDALLKQLNSGADFAKLAKENSGCNSSKDGGDLGYLERSKVVKPFGDAVFALKLGEMSGVVETEYGYHIIKLSEKRPSSKIPFDEVKAQIEDFLKRKKVDAAIKAIFEDAKKKAKIEFLI